MQIKTSETKSGLTGAGFHAACVALLLMFPCGAIPVYAQNVSYTGELGYIADLLQNLSGGIEEGGTVLQNAALNIAVDFASRPGVQNNRLSATLLWTNSNIFSNRYVGDLQSISNIDTDQATRLYELWYEYSFNNALNLRFGLYDLNSEFDVIKSAQFFLNGSHGIGGEFGLTGQNGPSVFPVTSLAARLHWQIDAQNTLRYALLDAVPGDPGDPSATRIKLGGDDGALHVLEYNHSFASGTHAGFGVFIYSKAFELLDQSGAAGTVIRDDNNAGFYAFADKQIYANESTGRRVSAYLRFGQAEQSINAIANYAGAGILLNGVFRGRSDDQLGLAVASARSGDDFRRIGNAHTHETSLELSYSAQINKWLRVQPDIQFVLNPGANRLLNDAFIFGVRLEAVHGFGE